MKTLRILAQAGATVSGPARVRLTNDQQARRSGLLGPVQKTGIYEVKGGVTLTFKRGEVIGLESAATERLNLALFEDITPVVAKPPRAAAARATDDKA